jgi:hypothetical protein
VVYGIILSGVRRFCPEEIIPMATVETSAVKAANLPDVLHAPGLCNGDRLTRAEFERRYSAMPTVKKAELIEGVVYMPSPVTHKNHAHLPAPPAVHRTTSASWPASYVEIQMKTDNWDRLGID